MSRKATFMLQHTGRSSQKQCAKLRSWAKYFANAMERAEVRLLNRFMSEGWFPFGLDCRRGAKNCLFLYLVL